MVYEHRLKKNALSKGQVLMICASCDTAQGDDMSAWLTEIAVPYCRLKNGGFDVTIASINGECMPLTQAEPQAFSNAPFATELNAFINNADAMQQLKHSVPLASIMAEAEPPAEDAYCALLLPGGPSGLAAGLAGNADVAVLVSRFFGAGRAVAAIGHGMAGLVHAEVPGQSGGGSLVNGLQLAMGSSTSSTDTAAAGGGAAPTPLAQLYKKLQAVGAVAGSGDDSSAAIAYSGAARGSGCIITGADATSSMRVSELLLDAMSRMEGPPSPSAMSGKKALEMGHMHAGFVLDKSISHSSQASVGHQITGI